MTVSALDGRQRISFACDDVAGFKKTWRSSGGVVAFRHRSRLLMFAHDIYSGTNGRLTPFIRRRLICAPVTSIALLLTPTR